MSHAAPLAPLQRAGTAPGGMVPPLDLLSARPSHRHTGSHRRATTSHGSRRSHHHHHHHRSSRSRGASRRSGGGGGGGGSGARDGAGGGRSAAPVAASAPTSARLSPISSVDGRPSTAGWSEGKSTVGADSMVWMTGVNTGKPPPRERRWAGKPEDKRRRRKEKAARLAKKMLDAGEIREGRTRKLLQPSEHIIGYTGHKPGKLGFGQEIYLESTPEIDRLLERLSKGLQRTIIANPVESAPYMHAVAKQTTEDGRKHREWQGQDRYNLFNHYPSEFTSFLDVCIRQGINPTATGHNSTGGFKANK